MATYLATASLVLLAAATAATQTTQPETAPPVNTVGEVTVETAPAMTVLVLPMTGSYDQHREAIGRLFQYAGSAGIAPVGAPFGVYHNDPDEVAEEALVWEIAVPVSADATAEAPFEVRQVPERQLAAVLCTGPFDGTTPCYEALYTWIGANGYTPAGPPEEHWISDPGNTPPESLQERIAVPVAGP